VEFRDPVVDSHPNSQRVLAEDMYITDFPASDGAFLTILACLRQSKTPPAGLGMGCFHRGPERNKPESLHMEQRGKYDIASPIHDDSEMPILARE